MNIQTLCDYLLPGDAEYKLAKFSSIVDDTVMREMGREFQSIDAMLSGFLSTDECAEKEFLTNLKINHVQLYHAFTQHLLGIYTALPQVRAKLHLSDKSLFPQVRTLPEIDFDLLFPVYERGPIWREVNEYE